jgi:hypothetical protein
LGARQNFSAPRTGDLRRALLLEAAVAHAVGERAAALRGGTVPWTGVLLVVARAVEVGRTVEAGAVLHEHGAGADALLGRRGAGAGETACGTGVHGALSRTPAAGGARGARESGARRVVVREPGVARAVLARRAGGRGRGVGGTRRARRARELGLVGVRGAGDALRGGGGSGVEACFAHAGRVGDSGRRGGTGVRGTLAAGAVGGGAERVARTRGAPGVERALEARQACAVGRVERAGEGGGGVGGARETRVVALEVLVGGDRARQARPRRRLVAEGADAVRGLAGAGERGVVLGTGGAGVLAGVLLVAPEGAGGARAAGARASD